MILRRWLMMAQQKANRIRTELEITEANVLLCKIGGRSFSKVNKDLAICALFDFGNNWRMPILVSEYRDAVRYNTSLGGIFNYLTTFQYEGKTYYVSNYNYAMGANLALENPLNLPILNKITNVSLYTQSIAGQQQAAKDLLDYYFCKI